MYEQVRYARVAKLVYAQHSKCCDSRHVGSSPTSGTIIDCEIIDDDKFKYLYVMI